LKNGISCDQCLRQGAHNKTVAFYSADEKKITLCQNRVIDKQELEDNLVHELVHAYDVRVLEPLKTYSFLF
jgi:hypothetical protein